MKKILTSIVAGIASLCIIITPAHAGSRQRHRWEGVAIGIGAAVLGHAIIGHHQHDYPHERPAGNCYYPPQPTPPPREYPTHSYNRGHWEVRKIWVEPEYERVWNPGHYDDYNRTWIPGAWIRIVNQPGYWSEERIWVGGR